MTKIVNKWVKKFLVSWGGKWVFLDHIAFVLQFSLVMSTNQLSIQSERDSLTVSMLACHVADPGSNPAQGNNFFN